MEYDFSQFLKDSKEHCKTKDDFKKRISREIDLVIETPSGLSSNLDRKAYFNRLEGAKFAAENGHFKGPDKYNDELRELLESLS